MPNPKVGPTHEGNHTIYIPCLQKHTLNTTHCSDTLPTDTSFAFSLFHSSFLFPYTATIAHHHKPLIQNLPQKQSIHQQIINTYIDVIIIICSSSSCLCYLCQQLLQRYKYIHHHSSYNNNTSIRTATMVVFKKNTTKSSLPSSSILSNRNRSSFLISIPLLTTFILFTSYQWSHHSSHNITQPITQAQQECWLKDAFHHRDFVLYSHRSFVSGSDGPQPTSCKDALAQLKSMGVNHLDLDVVLDQSDSKTPTLIVPHPM